jgi:hypothetical protein
MTQTRPLQPILRVAKTRLIRSATDCTRGLRLMETSNRLGAYCTVAELEVSLLPNSTTYCLTRGDSIGLSASTRSTSVKKFVCLLCIQFGVQASALSLLAAVLLTLVLLVRLSPFMWGAEAHAPVYLIQVRCFFWKPLPTKDQQVVPVQTSLRIYIHSLLMAEVREYGIFDNSLLIFCRPFGPSGSSWRSNGSPKEWFMRAHSAI